MENEIIKKYCILLYQEFYRSVNINSSYSFSPRDVELKTLDKFVVYINKEYNIHTIGEEFFINYTEVLFNKWVNSPLKFGNRSIMFSMIYGKKAIDFYKESKKESFKKNRFFRTTNKKVNDNLIGKCRKTYQNLVNINEPKKTTLSKTEEQQKLIFFNREEGLQWCIMNTTLYNDESKSCCKCDFNEDCKKTLMNNYPNTYKRRGYDK